jgi:translation initiation factor 3 subunit H
LNDVVRGWMLCLLVQALMKIIKCCSEAMPSPVSGCVVGLLVDGELEVTDSFATKRTVAATDEFDNASVQDAMLLCLGDIGADSTIVGWYQSTPFASESTVDLVIAQYEFQRSVPESVVIVYDPIASRAGGLPVKALRLTKAFMAAVTTPHEAAALAVERLKPAVLSSTVFEELPIRLHSNPVMSALLLDMAAPKAGAVASPATRAAEEGSRPTPLEGDALADLDRLEFTSPAFLERHLRLLSDQVTEMVAPVVNAQVWARREAKAQAAEEEAARAKRAEAKAPEAAAAEARKERMAAEERASQAALRPTDQAALVATRREALLAASQASVYCKELSAATSRKFGKLFLAGALHASD